jgi:radical SAM protein with 4Fe4S-binding SPASM domain
MHCRAEAQPEPAHGELTTEQAKEMISQLPSGRCLFIVTGGDPLLRRDIFQLTIYASALGLRVALALSGSELDDEISHKIASSGVTHVSISLDGSRAEIHDSFRGVSGAFERELKNLSYLKKVKLPFNILTTVTKHNHNDVGSIHNLVEKVGAAMWDLFMLVPTGRGRVEMEISPMEYEKMMNRIYSLSQRSSIPIKMTCAPQYQRIVEKGVESQSRVQEHRAIQHGCMAAKGYCFVAHNGEVYGCGFLPISAGNVKEQPFAEIYESSKMFNELRNQTLLKGKCRICEYRAVCGGCRARAYAVSNDYLAEEPYCIHNPKTGVQV